MLASNQFQPYGDGLERAQEVQRNRSKQTYLDSQRQPNKVALEQGFSVIFEGVGFLEFSRARVMAIQTARTGAGAGAGTRRSIVDAFAKTCERWGLNCSEQLVLLGYQADHVVGQQVLAGGIAPTSQDVRDRVGYVVGISLGLGALFGDIIDAEIDWLRHPRKWLDGVSPLEHMLEGHIANLIVVAEMVKHERGL